MSEFLPEGVTVNFLPDLPKISFKRDGIEYTVTDFRYLSEIATFVFKRMLECIAMLPKIEDVEFDVPEEYVEDRLQAVIDILLSAGYTAKKNRGKDRFMLGGRFITGTDRLITKSGNTVLSIHTDETFRKRLRKYVCKYPITMINLNDLVVYLAKEQREELDGWAKMKDGEEG